MTACNSTPQKFYTYAHYRADQPERGPFYIGKGKGPRAWKVNGRSEWWRKTAEKHGVAIEILSHWPTEEEAYSHERLLIECMRGMGLKVVNKNDGGDGAANPAPEVRAAIRERAIRQWSDPVERDRLIQARSSTEALARKSASLKRAFSQPESREKRSASHKALYNDQAYRERRLLMAQSPEYRAKLSQAQKAARARHEIKAKHDAANEAKKAATAARKANEPKPVVMSKRECGQAAGAAHRAKADARRALLPPEERARLEKQAADRLRGKQLKRERDAKKHQPGSDQYLQA